MFPLPTDNVRWFSSDQKRKKSSISWQLNSNLHDTLRSFSVESVNPGLEAAFKLYIGHPPISDGVLSIRHVWPLIQIGNLRSRIFAGGFNDISDLVDARDVGIGEVDALRL